MQSEARETNKQLKRIADELHEANRLKRKEQDAVYFGYPNSGISLHTDNCADHSLGHSTYGDDDMRRCDATPDGFCAWGERRGDSE